MIVMIVTFTRPLRFRSRPAPRASPRGPPGAGVAARGRPPGRLRPPRHRAGRDRGCGLFITYNGSPAALRALVLVTWLRAERRTCRWSCGRGDSDANCLRSRLSRPGLPPAQIDSTRSRRSRGAGRDRTLDRPHGRRHRARRGFGDGGLAVAELPQIAVSEKIFRVACERDCCAVLVAARAPRPARHSPGRTVIRPASAACLRAS